MRIRMIAAVALLGLSALTFSLLRGQGARPTPPAPPPSTLTTPAKELGELTQLQRQTLLAAQRGADWLFRMHNIKGRFTPGYLPALKQEAEGDYFLRQAAAAGALARAARFLGEDRYAARAAQAVLSLMEDTEEKGGLRTVVLPGDVGYKLECAGALLAAITELPSPQADVLDRGEQLAASIRTHAAPPAIALLGVMRSHKHRPAAWKPEFVARALPACKAAFDKARSPEAASALASALAECCLVTKDRTLTETLHGLADWAGELQYSQIDPRRLTWFGGFMSWEAGRAVETMPDARGAHLARVLVEACRVAREQGDAARHQRHGDSAERALQFLATLQYTDAATQHFAAWYRPRIVGGFHGSPLDGDLRLDHTAHAVAALAGHVEHAVR